MIHCRKQFILALAISLISILVTACSTDKEKDEQYTIANIGNTAPIKVYVITATAKDDIDALNEVANVAAKDCSANNERAEILDNRTQYQGLTDKQKNIIDKANVELDKSNGTFSDLDYKVTVRFRCLPRDKEKSLIKIANQLSGDEVTKKVK